VRRPVASLLALVALLIAAPAALAARGDTARYILPPGNFGGLPTTVNSTDQLLPYAGLTPLRDRVTPNDIDKLFLPEDFAPIGAAREEQTGRPGLRLVYDSYGIPHVYGRTRADMAFGAGWTTARDRGLLIQLGRGPARVAVADVPGINAFSLVTSGQSFIPSVEAEALVTKQRRLLVRTYGAKGRQIIADAQAYADGVNAYQRSVGNPTQPPASVNDVLAVTAFIGSIFGAGGGGEAANSELLSKLQTSLGPVRGHRAWEDVLLADDPEAPTTTDRRFRYGPLTGGRVEGSVVLDAGSVKPFVAGQPDAGATTAAAARATAAAALPGSVRATDAPPRRQASNWLLSSPERSATGNPLGVMGPQLGYYYPEIVQQIDLHGPGIQAQGAAVPGLAMYILIGRTKDYAWSLTSAGHDVRDVYAEQLCEPGGGTPTVASRHYVHKGRCIPFGTFFAGTLGGQELRYPTSVHGNFIGTATVGGRPYALTRKRSTFGRDALNLAALKDMTEGKASTPQRFWKAANQFGFTFNWGYVSRKATSFFSSGLLPRRAPHLDRRLPTLGTGRYEWRGYLSEREHPHDVGGPGGLLLNWNNRSAPGFMHGDDEPYGSVQRVENFDKFPRRVRLTDVVGIMNRAATEDVRSSAWPVVSAVLRSGRAPNARAAQVVRLLDDWVRRDAPRLDVNNDRLYDEAGPEVMDTVFRPLVEAVMRPVLVGDLLEDVDDVRGLGSLSGASYVDKDLRRLLRRPERGTFNLRYCGNGSLAACRASLWSALSTAIAEGAAENGPDPAAWRGTAARIAFTPGLIPNTIPFTNRPTFQQVLEFQRHG
jgi:acyl-homoserine lactone acylase PvdQ